jgi:hypothetical protein
MSGTAKKGKCKQIEENDSFIVIKINHKPVKCLLDTGAAASCISKTLADKLKLDIQPMENNFNLVTADKSRISVLGYTEVILDIRGAQIPLSLLVLPKLSQNLIIGNDFTRQSECLIDFKKRCMTLYDNLISVPL